ncbi:DUF6069 family protein [Streptomyces ovatisporus]|uniref:DUF6069 family protein n=1 Tax=Streptomyces ovatisporus TaxID=1128682 RepID=A0ABV9A484_9ACTN
MAGTHDPHGPQDPQDPQGPHNSDGAHSSQSPHGPEGPQGRGGAQRPGAGGAGRTGGSPDPGDASAQDGAFERFEPVPGYGPTKQYPDPYDGSGDYVPERRTNGYDHDQRPPRSARRRFSALRLWAGGIAVALVAALAAAVALLLVRGVLDIPVFAPETEGAMVPASTGQLALGAALAALVATAVLHLLLLATPQPGRFLAWIIALGTAAVMLAPFNSSATWAAKGGTAGVYLVIGLVIGTLMSTVARSASPARD